MDKSGSWIKKLASNFVEITPEEKNVEKVATVTANPTPVFTVPTTVSNTGIVDPKFIEHFAKLLEASNFPGPDYFEFSTALDELADLQLPEDKKFQAAWKSFSALGVKDTNILLNTAQKYLEILNKDKETFLLKVAEKTNNEVGSLQIRATEIENRNREISEQIAKLQAEVSKNNEESITIVSKIAEQNAKIANNKNNYEVTFSKVVEKIQLDLNKINQYIINK